MITFCNSDVFYKRGKKRIFGFVKSIVTCTQTPTLSGPIFRVEVVIWVDSNRENRNKKTCC